MTKRILFLTVIGMLAVSNLWAQHMRGRDMMGGGMQGGYQQRSGTAGSYYGENLSAEDREAINRMQYQYQQKTQSMRGRLNDKYRELDSLIYSQDPDQGKINELIDDINDLRARLFEENVRFRRAVYEQTGQQYRGGMTPSYGRPPQGPGMQRAPGYGPR